MLAWHDFLTFEKLEKRTLEREKNWEATQDENKK